MRFAHTAAPCFSWPDDGMAYLLGLSNIHSIIINIYDVLKKNPFYLMYELISLCFLLLLFLFCVCDEDLTNAIFKFILFQNVPGDLK